MNLHPLVSQAVGRPPGVASDEALLCSNTFHSAVTFSSDKSHRTDTLGKRNGSKQANSMAPKRTKAAEQLQQEPNDGPSTSDVSKVVYIGYAHCYETCMSVEAAPRVSNAVEPSSQPFTARILRKGAKRHVFRRDLLPAWPPPSATASAQEKMSSLPHLQSILCNLER